MLLTKILSGVSIGLLIVCGLLYWQTTGLRTDLKETEKKLETALANVEQKDRELRANDIVIKDLEKQNKDFAIERVATAKKLAEILGNPASSAWGNSPAPEDVRNFLNELKKENGGKK